MSAGFLRLLSRSAILLWAISSSTASLVSHTLVAPNSVSSLDLAPEMQTRVSEWLQGVCAWRLTGLSEQSRTKIPPLPHLLVVGGRLIQPAAETLTPSD